jgi:hypothetical protein
MMVLAIAPASALARHHHRRHHHRVHHARIERFGSDVSSTPTTSSPSENAGTVASFSGGVLTIKLGDGSTVSGMVTGDTELECTAPDQTQTAGDSGDGGAGDQNSGDEQSSGSDENQAQGSGDQSGEDQGDAAEQNDQAENENENDPGEENACATSSLTPGTVVRAAELRISSSGSLWKQLELGS